MYFIYTFARDIDEEAHTHTRAREKQGERKREGEWERFLNVGRIHLMTHNSKRSEQEAREPIRSAEVLAMQLLRAPRHPGNI